MAGIAQHQTRLPFDHVEPRGDRAAEAAGLVLGLQRFVREREHARQAALVESGGPKRVAHERAHRRGVDALARDIADRGDPAGAGFEEVVEVPARLSAVTRGLVERRHVQPGHGRQPPRAQAALEAHRDALLVAKQARVVECHGEAGRDLLEHGEIVGGVAARRFGGGEGDRAEQPAPCAQRQDRGRHELEHLEGAEAALVVLCRGPEPTREIADEGGPLQTGQQRSAGPGLGAGKASRILGHPAFPVGVAVCECSPHQRARRLEHLNRAPVRQPRHREAGHLSQRGGVVEGTAELARGLFQEALAVALLAHRGHVLQRHQGEQQLTLGAVQRPPADPEPSRSLFVRARPYPHDRVTGALPAKNS